MDKEKWIANMKSRSNIVWIESPKEDGKSSVQVAMDLWNMYEDDFNLTISDICKILLCDRNWVMKYVMGNVKYIFIGNTMRIFMKKINSTREMLKDYYYFSRSDFYRWLKENTKMERQSIVIDIMDYAYDKKSFSALVDKYEHDKLNSKNMLELAAIIASFNGNIYSYLDGKGKELYSLKQREDKRRGCTFILVNEELPCKFISSKILKETYANNERVYRSLFSAGAIKYTICDSLVRFDSKYNEIRRGKLDIIIPYKEYMLLK